MLNFIKSESSLSSAECHFSRNGVNYYASVSEKHLNILINSMCPAIDEDGDETCRIDPHYVTDIKIESTDEAEWSSKIENFFSEKESAPKFEFDHD